MFQSFTGSSRKPRHVNLSGQNTVGRRSLKSGQKQESVPAGIQAAVSLAQAQREQREHQRARINAARLLQKSWRGQLSRRRTRQAWRAEWDQNELDRTGPPWSRIEELCSTWLQDGDAGATAYESAEAYDGQMRLLLHFLDVRLEMDRVKLAYFGRSVRATWETTTILSMSGTEHSRALSLYHLSKLTVEALVLSASKSSDSLTLMEQLLSLLCSLSRLIPEYMGRNSRRYYSVLAALVSRDNSLPRKLSGRFEEALLALLIPVTTETETAYLAFAVDFLCEPEVLIHTDVNEMEPPKLNFTLLSTALNKAVEQNPATREGIFSNHHRSLWLLAHLIYLQNMPHGTSASPQVPRDTSYLNVLSVLLASQADEIKNRLDVIDGEKKTSTEHRNGTVLSGLPLTPLPAFVRDQILTLVRRDSIVGMMSQIEVLQPQQYSDPDVPQALATYALTLTRVLPAKRVVEVRMSLYEGSTKLKISDGTPAIVYLWQHSRSTTVVQRIRQDRRNVVPLLKQFLSIEKAATSQTWQRVQREWVTVLLFLELYSFAIKLMDDEDFLAGGRFGATDSINLGEKIRQSSLPLEEVRTLVIFLKNLASPLFWNSKDLRENEDVKTSFGSGDHLEPSVSRPTQRGVEKVCKSPQESARSQLRDVVTGLLRSIHQRDARRHFFEDDFWLMPSEDSASAFIQAVVAEDEQRRQELSDIDEESEDEFEDAEDLDDLQPDRRSLGWYNRHGPSNARQQRTLKEQKRLRQVRQMETIAPRLEMLRNLPFFISFDTRVRIFREFVFRDKLRRRGGNVDADAWRWSRGHLDPETRRRHHADIRRDNVFSSAFEQLYELGEGLKEPLQITFVDQFGAEEAGIDGGGVTKEFLTRITKEAFNPFNDAQLFAVNDRNLLYPNPGKLDAHIDLLRTAGVQDDTPEMEAAVRELLAHYRFLGRIVGKCLYEELLIDTAFAGHFLLQWGLAGGTTQAARASSYQFTVDDLRDLDKDFYQGVLKLKHYEGDVEADFSLNFTVVDPFEIRRPTPDDPNRVQVKSVVRSLIPDGANIPVTNSNRPLYISLLTDHGLRRQSLHQTSAFLSGLREIIQPIWLSMFNQSELQRLVGGDSREIDVADLRANTVYSGLYTMGVPSTGADSEDSDATASTVPGREQQQQQQPAEHPTIQIFWDVLRHMDDRDRRKVLEFVTSTPRAPLLGFSHLKPHFSIRDSGTRDESEGRLPSTSTCVNLLKLPMYTNAKMMKERLLYAINSGAGFDLS